MSFFENTPCELAFSFRRPHMAAWTFFDMFENHQKGKSEGFAVFMRAIFICNSRTILEKAT
jgi:hypothetical protein